MLSQPANSRRTQLIKLLIVLFILAIAAASAVPNYFTNGWPWVNLPEVEQIGELRAMRDEGLTIPGWTTLSQDSRQIGGKQWSVQSLVADDTNSAASGTPVFLLLRPQTWHTDQPQVEWMDIRGVQQWTADSHRRIHFPTPPGDSAAASSGQVEAQFLRGWTPQQTYAVLQWYAWPGGGSPSTSRWFWADQVAQWRDRHRAPWVAVSLLVPIEPLGKIEQTRPLAEQLGQAIQTALEADALN